MTTRITKLAARVRELERQHATLMRDLHQALADLDAACAEHFDVPAAASSGWQPPAQDSDEAEARAQAQRRRKGGA